MSMVPLQLRKAAAMLCACSTPFISALCAWHGMPSNGARLASPQLEARLCVQYDPEHWHVQPHAWIEIGGARPFSTASTWNGSAKSNCSMASVLKPPRFGGGFGGDTIVSRRTAAEPQDQVRDRYLVHRLCRDHFATMSRPCRKPSARARFRAAQSAARTQGLPRRFLRA